MGNCTSDTSILQDQDGFYESWPLSSTDQPETIRRIFIPLKRGYNISREERFKYIKQTYFSDWSQRAIQQSIQMSISEEKMGFIFSGKKYQEKQYYGFIESIRKEIQKIEVMKIQFPSKTEAAIKLGLYQQEIFQKDFMKQFNIDTFKVLYPEQSKTSLIFILTYENNMVGFQSLEYMLQQYIVQYTENDTINLQGYTAEEIQNEMEQFQQSQNSVQINYKLRRMIFSDRAFIISIEYTTWMLRDDQSQCPIQNLRNLVQEKLALTEIVLQDAHQIIVWNDLVSTFYTTNEINYLCLTKTINQNELQIELTGERAGIQQLKKEIAQNLDQYKLFSIQIKYEKDRNIMEFLRDQEWDNQFSNSLKKLEESQGPNKFRFKIKDFIINREQGLLNGQVIFNSANYSIWQIREIIKIGFLEKLASITTTGRINKLIFDLLGVQDFKQLEQKYEVYVHRDSFQTYLIGLVDQIESISKLLIHNDQQTQQEQIKTEQIITPTYQENTDNRGQIEYLFQNTYNTQNKEEKFLIISETYLGMWQEEMEISINFDKLSYEFLGDTAKESHSKISLFIRNLKVFKITLQSYAEKISKWRLCQEHQFVTTIKNQLFLDNFIAVDPNRIVWSKYACYPNLQGVIQALEKPEILIFIISFRKNVIDQKIEESLKNLFQYELVETQIQDKILDLGYCSDDINTEIANMQFYFPQIEISWRHELHNIILKYTTWKYQNDQDQSSNILKCSQKLKTQIQSLFSEAQIQLYSRDQIIIWEELICFINQQILDCSEIKKNDEQALIILKGKKYIITNLQQEILNYFSCYKLIKIVLNGKNDRKLYKILRKQNCQEIFSQSLKDLEEKFGHRRIRILINSFSLKNDQGCVKISIIFNENEVSIYQVSEYIQLSFVDQLTIVQAENFLSKTELGLFQKTLSQMQQKLEIYLHQEGKNFYLIGLIPSLQNLKNQIKSLSDQPELKLNILEYSENEKVKFLQNEQMITTFCDFTQKETEFIYSFRKEIQEIEKQLQCSITKEQCNKNVNIGQTINDFKDNKQIIIIRSFNLAINDQARQQLNEIFKDYTISTQIIVPNLFYDEIQQYKQMIENNTFKVEGQIRGLAKLTLYVLKTKFNEISRDISDYSRKENCYPNYWVEQNGNFLKIQLQKTDSEYKKIENYFKDSDNGTIIKIYRIQNKQLWENYWNAKKELLKDLQKQGIQLQSIEQDRLLWHGVRRTHPKTIYENEREAFDAKHSNAVSMWGRGIYFAESAKYSRNYSYQLQSEEPSLNGYLVLLCCQVTTGRVENRAPDNSIIGPSQDYDCISGSTCGDQVFVLYSQNVRRAYPAYEIIFS